MNAGGRVNLGSFILIFLLPLLRYRYRSCGLLRQMRNWSVFYSIEMKFDWSVITLALSDGETRSFNYNVLPYYLTLHPYSRLYWITERRWRHFREMRSELTNHWIYAGYQRKKQSFFSTHRNSGEQYSKPCIEDYCDMYKVRTNECECESAYEIESRNKWFNHVKLTNLETVQSTAHARNNRISLVGRIPPRQYTGQGWGSIDE